MKQGWEIKKLCEVCDLQNGFAFKSGDYVEFSNTVNFRMSQIRPGGGVDLENNPKYLPDEFAETYKDYLLKEGDIVIAMTDMATETKILGVPTIVPSDSRNWLLNQRVGKLFNIDKSKVNFAYLKYILVSEPINEYYKKLGRGGLQINISKQDILNAEIPLPPLPEQQRIVSVLDKAFAAIDKAKANAEQNLKDAKELFESYLQSVFENGNWVEKTLGDVCEFTQGIQRDVKLQSEIQKENQVRFLRIVDFTQGNEPPRFIDNPGDKYILNSSDISLVRYGASTGFVCRGLEGALANNLFRVIPKTKKEITNDFLFVYLNAPIFQNVIKESMNGAAMPAISFGLIKDIPFPIISLKEQETIVQKLNALSAETTKLEAIYQKKLEDLEELKKSILQKAFSGELNTTKDIAV
ncbi:MAG TPA: restriction endonuclease subunit S [Niabella sp.]|nr:restriction endonuclease subunit S [Niabella sp.]